MLLRRKIKSPAATAALPLALHASSGALLHSFPAAVVDSVRHMENVLTYGGQLPKRIALVSALSGEGVTYSALALATTLANDLPARVCAVELNWYSPGMAARLSEPVIARPKARRWRKARAGEAAPPPFAGGPGLAGVLTQGLSLDDALISTGLPNLQLLPAGDLPPQQRPGMARGDALKHCIDQLSQRFDHIVLDVPAIHSTGDAVALASLGDGCCVVVRQGLTPANSVRRALDDLKHLTMLGVILNQAYSHMPRWMSALVPTE
jgi:Mrp family chromosome partitioning ATPase